MTWFSNLRILAFLRRIARALEDIADFEREQARIARMEWERLHPVRKRAQSKVDLGTLDIKEANRAYHHDLIAAGLATADDFPEDQA